jgi:hypothetical protein
MLSIIIAMTAFGLTLLVFAMFILSYPSLKHAASLRNNISNKSINLHIPTSNHILRLLGLHIEKVLVEGRRFLSILKNDKVLTALLFGIIIFGVIVIGLMAILAMYLFY